MSDDHNPYKPRHHNQWSLLILQLVDLNGNTLCSSNPESVGKLNVADRQYFKDALTGKAALSEVLVSKSTGKPIIVIAVPIDSDGKTKGVFFALRCDRRGLRSRVQHPGDRVRRRSRLHPAVHAAASP